MADLTNDLNATLTSAIQARVGAAVLEAASSDAVLSGYVAAALNQTIEIGDYYEKRKVPFIHHVVSESIRKATENAVRAVLADEMGAFQTMVRKVIKARTAQIAETLVASLLDAAGKTYGVDVKVDLKMPTNHG